MRLETIPKPILRAWREELERLRAAGTPVTERVEGDVLQALLDRDAAGYGVPVSYVKRRVPTTSLLHPSEKPSPSRPSAPALDNRTAPEPIPPDPASSPRPRRGVGRAGDSIVISSDTQGSATDRTPAPPPRSPELVDDAFDGLGSLTDEELADLMSEVGGASVDGGVAYDPNGPSMWQTLFDVDPSMADKLGLAPLAELPTDPRVLMDTVKLEPRGAKLKPRKTTARPEPPSPMPATKTKETEGDEDPLASLGAATLTQGPRFCEAGEVLSGAQGLVMPLKDADLGRTVILKRLRLTSRADAGKIDQFIAEAKLTAQLEHPHIVPVYDFGRLSDGSVYYTMRRVQGVPLSELIEAARRGDASALERLSLSRCVSLILQLCRALDYAHRRGVVHRDLKSDNVMVTSHGDAMLMDWGLAKIVSPSAGDDDLTHDSLLANPRRYETTMGTVKGTPAYMAPEQAMGRINLVDSRTDVYSLGAILYELLTYHPPFSGRTIREVLGLLMVENPVPPRRRCPERGIPARVEAICLRCLEKDPDDRYVSARELAAELESFVDGGRLLLRAEALYVEGRQHSERAAAGRDRLPNLKKEVNEAGAAARAHPDREDRRLALWAAQDSLAQLQGMIQKDETEAEACLRSCLACADDHPDARIELDRLYARLEQQAQMDGDAQQLAKLGQKRQALKGFAGVTPQGLVSLSPSPPAAGLKLERYVEADRRLATLPMELPGSGLPLRHPLPEGSYVFTLSYTQHDTVRYPVVISRGEHWKGFVNLPREGTIGRDYVLVPAGPARLGGDPQRAFDHVTWLPTYLIGKEPVTLGEYLVYLQDLTRRGEPAEDAVPRCGGVGPLACQGADGQWRPRVAVLAGEEVSEATARSMPVVGVTLAQALAYCAWRSRVTRMPHRLPTVDEWEKAARGVDGRRFPWGDRFDPTFCYTARRPGLQGLAPTGVCAADISPYGAIDMAGGVLEWCTPPGGGRAALQPVRGGSWMDTCADLAPWSHRTQFAGEARADLGFRLIRDGFSTSSPRGEVRRQTSP